MSRLACVSIIPDTRSLIEKRAQTGGFCGREPIVEPIIELVSVLKELAIWKPRIAYRAYKLQNGSGRIWSGKSFVSSAPFAA